MLFTGISMEFRRKGKPKYFLDLPRPWVVSLAAVASPPGLQVTLENPTAVPVFTRCSQEFYHLSLCNFPQLQICVLPSSPVTSQQFPDSVTNALC